MYSLDITESVKSNDNIINITAPSIHNLNEGIAVEGVIRTKIYDIHYAIPFNLVFSDETKCAQILFNFLQLTYIKDGGFGFPDNIDIVFNDLGEPIDIIGQPTRFLKIWLL